MKRLSSFIILALFLDFATITCAQEAKEKGLSLALNCGLTRSKIKSFPSEGVIEYNLPDKTQKFTLGYYYGISANYKMKNRYIITSGANYMVNRIKYTIPEVTFQRTDSLLIDANGKIQHNTNTLYIPLHFSYLFGDKANIPFVTVGAALNFYLGTKVKYRIYNDEGGEEVASGESKYRLNDYMGRNFCIALGGGLIHKLTDKLDIKAAAIYNLSTSKVFKKGLNINVDHRINFFQLGLSLNYNL